MIEAVRGQAVGYRRLGTAILPGDETERALLIESEQLLTEDGFQARWDGTRLVNPRDGEADPSRIVGALARQARAGAIREGVNVTSVTARRSGVVVTAGEEMCVAGVVVLATNAYSPQLVPWVRGPADPAHVARPRAGPEPRNRPAGLLALRVSVLAAACFG